LLGATFTGSDAMDAFLFLTGQSSADFLETLTMQVYEFDDIDDSGGGGGGNGNGGGNGKKSESKNNKQKTEQKIIESIKVLKATDLALNLNQYNSVFASKITSNVFYKRGVPVIEISGNYYRLYYSQELNNNYTTGEFIYDTTGTLTG